MNRRIYRFVYRTRIFILISAIVLALMVIVLQLVLLAQQTIPFEYNDFVVTHRYLNLAEVKEPTLTLGNDWKTEDIVFDDFSPIYWDVNDQSWIYNRSLYKDILWIDNPNAESFYVTVRGTAVITFDNEVDWSYCGPTTDHMGSYELGASCAMFISQAQPDTFIIVSHKPPE